jgi:hypothetical protein
MNELSTYIFMNNVTLNGSKTDISSPAIDIQYSFFRTVSVNLEQNFLGQCNDTALSLSISPISLLIHWAVSISKENEMLTWFFLPLFMMGYGTESYIGVEVNYISMNNHSLNSGFYYDFPIYFNVTYPLFISNKDWEGKYIKMGFKLGWSDKYQLHNIYLGYSFNF